MNKQTMGSVEKHKLKLHPLKGKERVKCYSWKPEVNLKDTSNETKGSLDFRNSRTNLF